MDKASSAARDLHPDLEKPAIGLAILALTPDTERDQPTARLPKLHDFYEFYVSSLEEVAKIR